MNRDERMLRITRKDGTEHIVRYDAADAELVESRTWHIHRSHVEGLFYACTDDREPDGKRTRLYMHAMLTGTLGADHINHDGLDNRRSNLRPATPSQNGANRRPNRRGSSPYKGVTRDRPSRKWRAQITVEGSILHLGSFDDETAAARAYDQAARDAFGEFAHLNLPAAEREPWLGHLNGCSIQWSNVCDCDPHAPVEFSEEERPEDDPAPIPTCDGRYCGGRPHE